MQSKLIYSIPNYGQIPRIFTEQSFYEYILVCENLTHTSLQIPLDVMKAQTFADNNNLKRISSFGHIALWEEKENKEV
jgi:hypothetical protein